MPLKTLPNNTFFWNTEGFNMMFAILYFICFRIRLPEDRDPRQGIAPLFGVHVAPNGKGVGVIRVGDSVMVSL